MERNVWLTQRWSPFTPSLQAIAHAETSNDKPVLCHAYCRSGLRSPAGRLPASIFSATPNPQNPITGALGALGPLRPAFSNTTAAQQALLLPGPDPSLLFKLVWRQDLAGGLLPDSAVQATDAAGQPLLCVLCTAAQQLLAFQLPR